MLMPRLSCVCCFCGRQAWYHATLKLQSRMFLVDFRFLPCPWCRLIMLLCVSALLIRCALLAEWDLACNVAAKNLRGAFPMDAASVYSVFDRLLAEEFRAPSNTPDLFLEKDESGA